MLPAASTDPREPEMMRGHRSMWRWWALGAGALVVMALVLGLSGCHGRTIHREFVPNHYRDFDFRDPPCAPTSRPEPRAGEVLVRYLGTSGLYVLWRDVAILTAPYFSNHGLRRAIFGSVGWDDDAIARGMEDLDPLPIQAMLVGHAHFDHFADLPPVLSGYAPEATVLLNRSGMNMLAGCSELTHPMIEIDDRAGSWIDLESPDGEPLPVRVMPLRSGHAPHLGSKRLIRGEVDEPWETCLQGKRLRALKPGQSFAFLIDLLDENGDVAFRIHHQDAASDSGLGFPAADVMRERPVDLAVVCMPSFWLVDAYPRGILGFTEARHALITHYEDFFRATDKSLRFVPTLTDAKANRFMDELREEMRRPVHRTAGSRSPMCGPASDAWSMPLPGEWMVFRADDAPSRLATGTSSRE
jgi:hypothetical protein